MQSSTTPGHPSTQQATTMSISSDKPTKVDYSCIRGKTVLVSPTEEQYEALTKRLQERIADSRGETVYEIGVGEGR